MPRGLCSPAPNGHAHGLSYRGNLIIVKKILDNHGQMLSQCGQMTMTLPPPPFIAQDAPANNYLTPAEMAALMKVSIRTLARWRNEGNGPAWVKYGGVIRYLGPNQ